MQKTKRPLSFLLAVLMIVSMFAAVPFTASAEDKVIGENVIFKLGDTIVLPGNGIYIKRNKYEGAREVHVNGTVTQFESDGYQYSLEIEEWGVYTYLDTFEYWEEMEQGLSVLGITFSGSGTESDPYMPKLALGEVESTWAGVGEGTEASPWLIKDLNDLRTLSANVASGMTYSGKYLKLTTDIDCGSDNWETIGGADAKMFRGTFDGDEKTITYSIICSENDALKGLFAQIGSAGTVKNLNVAGSIVNTAEYAGPAGGIAAYNSGLIENCYSAVDITKGCDRGTGGIAAYNEEGGTIRYCAASGTLTWTGASDSYAYIGGITGENYNYNDEESEIKIKYVTNCAMLGDVLAENATDQYNYAGRLIGRQYDDTTSDDCYYLDTMTVTGVVNSDSVTAKTAEELKAIGQAAIDAGYTVYGLALGGSLSNPDQEAADAVIALIDAIGTVEYTDACKEKIDAARAAYDALTDAQKALVDNYTYTTLTDAETAYAALAPATYTVTWRNYNGDVLETDTVTEGDTPTYDGAAPVMGADPLYTYNWSGWSTDVVPAAGDATYIAAFDAIPNTEPASESLVGLKLCLNWSYDFGGAYIRYYNTSSASFGVTELTKIWGYNNSYQLYLRGADGGTYVAVLSPLEGLTPTGMEITGGTGTQQDPYTISLLYSTPYMPVASVSLSGSEKVFESESVALTASFKPTYAANLQAVWSVDNDNVALYTDAECTTPVGSEATDALTVYAKGVNVGTAAVTVASAENTALTATCNVKVYDVSDKVVVNYTFSDAGDDSWNGAKILIREKGSDNVVATLTKNDDGGSVAGSVALFKGCNYELVWMKGYYDDECSFTITDSYTGEEITASTSDCNGYTNGQVIGTLNLAVEATPNDQQFVTIDDQISITLALDLGTRGVKTDDVTINREVESVQAADTEGVYNYKIVMAPAQIADEIVVTIGSGNDAEEITTSIKGYCNELRGDAYNEYADAQALACAILAYGQAASNRFNGTTDEIPFLTANDVTAAQNAAAVFSDGTGKVSGASFMALTKPEFRFYTANIDEQTAYDYNQTGITVTMAGASQEQLNALNARFVKKADRKVLIEVTGVTAENMDKEITVTVADLGTITFNGNAFAKAMAKSGDTKQQNLGAALYNYGAAAKDCFGA